MRFLNRINKLPKIRIAASALTLLVFLFAGSSAFSQDVRHFPRARSWELVVKSEIQKNTFSFPVTVANVNEPEELKKTLPVLATPIKIELNRYLPDLVWQTIVTAKPGGIVAKIFVQSPDLNRDVWLTTADFSRRSVSYDIGSVTLIKISDANRLEVLCKKLTQPNSLGLVSVGSDKTDLSFDFAVFEGQTVNIPVFDCNVTVLRYVPHFSFSTQTGKVTSLSKQPVNPAIEVKLDFPKKSYKTWLWSKFPRFSHQKKNLPFNLDFTHFDLSVGNYYIVTAVGARPRLIYSQNGRIRDHFAEEKLSGKSYPFAGEDYSFIIEDIYHNAEIKKIWRNSDNKLLNPALVVTVKYDDVSEQIVLKKDKAEYVQTEYGALSLLYRKK